MQPSSESTRSWNSQEKRPLTWFPKLTIYLTIIRMSKSYKMNITLKISWRSTKSNNWTCKWKWTKLQKRTRRLQVSPRIRNNATTNRHQLAPQTRLSKFKLETTWMKLIIPSKLRSSTDTRNSRWSKDCMDPSTQVSALWSREKLKLLLFNKS